MSQTSHTLFAGKAIGLAELFNILMSKVELGDGTKYTPKLTAPEGESTGGGKQSLQHLTLVPAGGGSVLLVGTVNTVSQEVELKSWAHASGLHQQRWKGAAYPVSERPYGELVAKVRAFFEERKYRVTVTEASATPPAPAPAADEEPAPTASGGVPKWLIAAGVALAVAVVGVLVLRR